MGKLLKGLKKKIVHGMTINQILNKVDIGLQFSDVFKLRPDSFSTSDQTYFCLKVRTAVNDYLTALDKTLRLQPSRGKLKDAHNLFTAHTEESVLD